MNPFHQELINNFRIGDRIQLKQDIRAGLLQLQQHSDWHKYAGVWLVAAISRKSLLRATVVLYLEGNDQEVLRVEDQHIYKFELAECK